jgi:hypothetical protein
MKFLLRPLLASLLLLLTSVYVWQVGSTWRAQEAVATEDELMRSSGGMIAWRQTELVGLHGVGIATGAQGLLRFNGYDPIGILRISDMPTLAPSQVYQLWCHGVDGHIDASTAFRVPVDSDEVIVVMIVAPRIFNNYTHFSITAETAAGAKEPTGLLVMSN